MSAPLRPSLLPRCTSCARRLADSGSRAWSPFQQQLRGKKQASKLPQTIPVRLLKDVKGFGRKGSLVPVAPGQMRNEWFPSRTADYVTPMQLREIKANDVSIERDHTFGMEQVEVQGDKGPEVLEIAKPKAIEVEKISAQRSLELINNLVPARIDVRKSANVRPQQQQKPREQPRHRGMSAADVLAAASAPPPEPVDTRVPIHGSVSTTDIAAIIKEQLSVNEEGSRVVVSESDVRWLNGTSAEDPTRVRFLGEYEVEIKLKGADEGVTRKIRVLPLASSSEVVPEVGS
ncbi:Ribosomal protein L9/RNase H1 [Macrophomina phaseolina MS6]|uniref:Ribosomal protein L9/RNase H1 n=1 Tax=Macrophomina phaseolina (strain MS6) TaxID=1126212 RepID=K2S5F4_MACPH|nr:Ribosomal protein L9/RNase H1 [Macrophomina phaseolina MS6]